MLLIDKYKWYFALKDTFYIEYTWARAQTVRSTAYLNGCPYIFLIYYYYTIYVCVPHVYDLSAFVGSWPLVSSCIRRIYNFLMCAILITPLLRLVGRLHVLKPINLTSVVTVVTPTDRLKSVSNHCVIEVVGGVFVLSNWLLDFSVCVGAFVIGLSQIPTFFSFK